MTLAVPERHARTAQWVAAGLGAFLRFRQYLHGRPVWLDEAMLLNNILGRRFGELLAPLESDQTAPVPFLWVVKLCANLFGTDERVLRLAPFLAGLALLVVVVFVARRVLPPWPAAVAVLFAALSPMLIYYANEVKPYGVDALWLALLTLLALRLGERPEARGRWVALLLTGTWVALASSPAPFVLAAAGLALVLMPGVRRAPGAWGWFAAMALIWGVAFGTEYLLVYRAASDSMYMQRFWLPFFLSPALPGLLAKADTALTLSLQQWFLASGGGWRVLVAYGLLLPMLAGVITLARRHGPALLALLFLPLALALLASSVQAYPAAPRLLLFALPGLILALAAGTGAIAEWLGRRWPVAWLAVGAAALAFLPGLDAARMLLEPYEREALAPLIARVRAEHQPGAAIYVFGRSVPAWVFYTTDWRAPDLARVHGRSALVSSTGGAFRHAASRRRPVVDEGDDLIFGYADWRELIGVPTGTGPDSNGVNALQPDTGWAENEARRLKAAGGPEAWVVMSSFIPGAPDLVDSALIATGGRRVFREERSGAVLSRWEFRP